MLINLQFKKIFFLIVLYSFCLNCEAQNRIGISFPDSLKRSDIYFSPLTIYEVIPIVNSIINIGDTFDSTLNFQYSYDDNNEEDDSAGTIEEKQKGLTIIVDTLQEIDEREAFFKTYRQGKLYASPRRISYINSKKQSTSVLCDKDTNFVFKSLPVYIVNNTTQKKVVYLKEMFIEMVQEALDKNGKWRAIELTKRFKCGMGFGWHALQPNQYLITNILKYKGNYETLLRIKFKNGNTIYYSEPFNGSINYSQFNTSKVKYVDEILYELK